MDNTIFITLEPYLAQWLKHQMGGTSPIPVKRASAEAAILQMFLQKQPRDPQYRPQIKALPGQVEILLPRFRLRDTRTYNYLPPRGEMALHQCIRNRFKVALWTCGRICIPSGMWSRGRTSSSLTGWRNMASRWMIKTGTPSPRFFSVVGLHIARIIV